LTRIVHMSERNLALVTGASGGIGLELARLLAEKGFNLVLLARSRNKLEELARELETAHGIQAAVVAADLSEPDAPQAVFDELLQKAIQVDLQVNNAAARPNTPSSPCAPRACSKSSTDRIQPAGTRNTYWRYA
jgi:short-subunit dehydrogenase